MFCGFLPNECAGVARLGMGSRPQQEIVRMRRRLRDSRETAEMNSVGIVACQLGVKSK